MPQIGFTDKQSSVFHRFNALRRAYEDANGGGRIYNPDFLTVLMDAWEMIVELQETQEKNPDQVIVLGFKDKVSVGDNLDVIGNRKNKIE